MRDHTEQRQAIDALGAQEVRAALFLAKDEHEQTAAATWVASTSRRAPSPRCMTRCRRRRSGSMGSMSARRKRLASTPELPLHGVHVRATGNQNPPRLRFVRDGDEQMLEANGVVPKVGRQPERTLDRLQRLRRERNRTLAHSASIVTSSGNSCSSASCLVVFTFVWATS